MPDKSKDELTITAARQIVRGQDSRDVHLLDIVTTIARRIKFILFAAIGCAAIVVAFSFVMPNTFSTTISILPPEKSQQNPLASLLGGGGNSISTFDFADVGENHSSDFYLDMLKSRTLAESLLVDFPDIRRYFAQSGKTDIDQSEVLLRCASYEIERDGLVKATVESNTGYAPSEAEQKEAATRAANIANALSFELDKISRVKGISRAHNSRVFVESQLQATNTQLDTLYNRMTAFQKEYKIIALDKQVESEIGTAADLLSQIKELELRRSYILHNQSSSSLEVKQIETRIAELRSQYNAMNYGGDTSEYYIPFPKVPELQKQYAGMVRDLKALEQVDMYLQNQYYQDRVQEERDLPIVQVLDNAPIPEQRSSPKRKVMAITAFLISGLLACLWVLIAEYLRNVSAFPSERERMYRLMAAIAPRSRYAKTLANENVNGIGNGAANGARRSAVSTHEHQSHPKQV